MIIKQKKDLLVFAHRGEASAFLKHYDLKADSRMQGLYSNDDFVLLICGEGKYEAFCSLASLPKEFSFSRIINFGVAASIHPQKKHSINTVFKVRTLYHQGYNKLEFHSFTCDQYDKEYVDCISLDNRLVDSKLANKLSHFADLVDREAWALAYVSHKLKIPFECYKVVSDFANNETNCQLVMDRAKEFSESLLTSFLKHNIGRELSLNSTFENNYLLLLLKNLKSNNCFHLTFAQAKKIEALLEKVVDIKSFNQDWKNIISKCINLSENPKKRTMLLISFLEEKLLPLKSQLKKDLENELALINQKLEMSLIKYKLDPMSEKPHLYANFQIQNASELQQLKDDTSKLIANYALFERIYSNRQKTT